MPAACAFCIVIIAHCFLALQVITGLDLFTYEQDEEAHSYTLKQTLAQVMSGLTMDDIVEVVITDVPATAKTTSAVAKTVNSQVAHTSAMAVPSADVEKRNNEDKPVLSKAPHHGAAHLRTLQTTPATSAVKASFKVLSYSAYSARQLVTQLQQSLASGELFACYGLCVRCFLCCCSTVSCRPKMFGFCSWLSLLDRNLTHVIYHFSRRVHHTAAEQRLLQQRLRL